MGASVPDAARRGGPPVRRIDGPPFAARDGGSAVLGADGAVLALARAVWISVPEAS